MSKLDRVEASAPFEVPDIPPHNGEPVALPPEPSWVPKPAAECKAYTEIPPRRVCDGRDAAFEALADALATNEEKPRDRALRAIEGCEAFPIGFMRALRAELWRACADVLAHPLLAASPRGVSGELIDTFRGLALVAWSERFTARPPVMGDVDNREAIVRFFEEEFDPWLVSESEKISEILAAAKSLVPRSYGSASVRVSVAHRASRMLEIPTAPERVRRSAELRRVFADAYDHSVGRYRVAVIKRQSEAAELASAWGLLRHDPTERWTLSWGPPERRNALVRDTPLSALSRLLLPSRVRSAAESSASARVARRLPGPFAPFLFSISDDASIDVVEALAFRGLAPAHRRALADVRLNAGSHHRFGRMFTELGLVFPSRWIFALASTHLAQAGGSRAEGEATLLQAIVQVLASGPENFEEWMSAKRTLDLGPVIEFDTKDAELKAVAAFDERILREWNEPPVAIDVLRNLNAAADRGLKAESHRACLANTSEQPRFVHGQSGCSPWPWR